MSISKKIIVSLSLLAIIGGISIAVISVSANGKILDSQAFAFIQNGDLNGYKTYMINEQTAPINDIDQARFDMIKTKYTAAKPLMDLQTKYESQLTIFATSKDQASYVSTFKQYQKEALAIGAKYKGKATTEEQLNKKAMNSYEKSVKDLAEGRQINISRFNNHGGGLEKYERVRERKLETK
jgi:hypothetical protein